MHAVVWTSGDHCFAIASRQIVEVIPVVQARPVPQRPAWVRGLINYRQNLIPLVDVARLLGTTTPEPRMANRVLVLRTDSESHEPASLIGMLVARVLGIQNLDFEESTGQAETNETGFEFLGPVTLTESGTIQFVNVNRLPTADATTTEP